MVVVVVVEEESLFDRTGVRRTVTVRVCVWVCVKNWR